VLAEGGRGAEQVAEGTGERHDLRREHRGEGMQVCWILDRQYAIDAGELCRLGGDRRDLCGEHGDGDLRPRERAGAGDALGGAEIELLAVMLGNDEDLGAHSSPFFLSASTSS